MDGRRNIKICRCCKQVITNRLPNAILCKNCFSYVGKVRREIYGKYYRKARHIKRKLLKTLNKLIK